MKACVVILDMITEMSKRPCGNTLSDTVLLTVDLKYLIEGAI